MTIGLSPSSTWISNCSQNFWQIVHANQYGFIHSRTIQDCLAWSFEYIHQCRQSKKELIILKLDFAKAFETVEHEVILLMMQHLGFPSLWLDWIKLILSSGTSSVILNGVPGRQFKCKRGVRQGDPYLLCSLSWLLSFSNLLSMMPCNRDCYHCQSLVTTMTTVPIAWHH